MITSNQTILIFLRRIGPYHHARFQSLAQTCRLVVAETRPGSQEYPWSFSANGRYIICSFPISANPEMGLRGKLLTNQIAELIQLNSPSCIVTTGWADAEYHAVALIANSKKIPLVVISDSRHEDEPRKWHKELVKRLILKSYSAALVAGTSSKDYLIKLGFKKEAIFQPWDVVDNDYFQQATRLVIPYHERRFICIARFIPKKNVEGLLQAFAAYRKEGGHRKLFLVGSGPLEEAIRLKVSNLKLETKVMMPGFIQYEELPSYFARSFCLILPSFSDQWGLVVNEAMAAGLPVIVSTNCGSAVDLVQGSNGYQFNSQNPIELANFMRQIDEKSEDNWNMMASRSQHIIRSWNLNQFAQGLMEACLYACKNKKLGLPFLHVWLSKRIQL